MVDGGLLRNGEDGGLEGDIVDGARGISLCRFEGIIGAIERMRKRTFMRKRLETHWALYLSLIEAGEGIKLLRLINARVKLLAGGRMKTELLRVLDSASIKMSGIVTFRSQSREGTKLRSIDFVGC